MSDDFEFKRPKDELRPLPEPKKEEEEKPKPKKTEKSPVEIETVSEPISSNIDMGPIFENMDSMFENMNKNMDSVLENMNKNMDDPMMFSSYKKTTKITTTGSSKKQKSSQEDVDQRIKKLEKFEQEFLGQQKLLEQKEKKRRKKKDKASKGKSGVGICTILFIVFLTLKLTGNISWSWWWVFAPYWIPAGVGLSIGLIALLIVCIAFFVKI